MATAAPAKRGRGRPAGSKNQPKENGKVKLKKKAAPAPPTNGKRRGRPPGAKNKSTGEETKVIAPTRSNTNNKAPKAAIEAALVSDDVEAFSQLPRPLRDAISTVHIYAKGGITDSPLPY